MFKKILVPLDGSVRAEQAIPIAARIARAYEGVVVLVQVVHPPIEHEAYMPGRSALTQTALDAEFTQAEDYLKGVTYGNDLADIKTEIQVHVGSPASMILACAESLSPDIIVMSSHGYTGLKRWVLGSVAEKLVHHAAVPILVLRDEGLSVPRTDAAHPLRALVALDGSQLAETVLEPTAYLVAALAAPTQGALHLVQLVDLPLHDGQLRRQAYAVSIIEQAELEAKGYLSMIADRFFQGPLADLHLAVTTSVVNDPDVAGALIDEAEDPQEVDHTAAIHGCDLIAMATHGRGGLQRWATGSVTERVLHATKLPLLVVRPTKEVMPELKSAKTTDAGGVEREQVAVSTPTWVGLF